MLIRQRVSAINVCHFCIDIGRAKTIDASMDQAKFDALAEYETSNLFTEKEKVLLNFVVNKAIEKTGLYNCPFSAEH